MQCSWWKMRNNTLPLPQNKKNKQTNVSLYYTMQSTIKFYEPLIFLWRSACSATGYGPQAPWDSASWVPRHPLFLCWLPASLLRQGVIQDIKIPLPPHLISMDTAVYSMVFSSLHVTSLEIKSSNFKQSMVWDCMSAASAEELQFIEGMREWWLLTCAEIYKIKTWQIAARWSQQNHTTCTKQRRNIEVI